MTIEIREVKKQAELRQFIRFPYHHYRNHPFWLPPLLPDERNFFRPEKNEALAQSDIIIYNAWKHDAMAGRIMGIINHGYNKSKGEKRARFFKFECINDQEAAHALISKVEAWAIKKGMEEIIGPFGFSDKDPQGLLISGFDQRAVIIAPYNHPYYPGLVEQEGYRKEIELVEYLIPVPAEIPEFYSRILAISTYFFVSSGENFILLIPIFSSSTFSFAISLSKWALISGSNFTVISIRLS